MTKTRYRNVVILTGLAFVHWATAIFIGADLVDDSYIFLRYAENFADGTGLVFNIGERVEGFTSPLWVLLLSMAAWAGSDLSLVAKYLSAAFSIATIGWLFYVCQTYLPRNQHWLAVVPCWFLATTPAFVYWVWSAMDTALFTFLFFCTLVFFIKNVEPSSLLLWPGLCYSLATITRLDMLATLPAYLFFIYYFNRSNKSLFWKKYLSFLAPLSLLLMYILWRYSFYGALLPNTYYAKAWNIPTSILLTNGLTYTFNFFKVYGICLGIAAITLVFISSEKVFKECLFSMVIIIIWIGFVTSAGGDHFSMFRFYVAVLPVLAFFLVFLVKWIVYQLELSVKSEVIIGISAILTFSALNYTIYIYGGGANTNAEIQNARAWAEVGRWLEQNLPTDTKIATVVVGAIPYYSGFTTYDLTGLTSRDVAIQGKVYLEGKVGHQKYNTDYILSQRPDFIISPASGLFSKPVGAGLDKSYNYSLYHLITDQRTMELYQYQVFQMENGKFVEALQLKSNP